ncbi:hypothetical protein B0T17DRAFT_150669 [Bombardia bombarda]|uniref:Uncharacterized protein n=1 Tax=Bombardia bombarda TaxID=252184 RepID=A0AA40C8C6_9PEZI|nr:hypothetical protein B0T17DRAFT_150669 [Bombardia bombarda]
MSLFYAYAISVVIPTNASSYQLGSGNYVITFANRAVADEWWRAITDIAKTDSNYVNITRVTPQLYNYDYSKINIATTISNANKAQSFYDRVFFTPFSGALSIIPLIDITDHISGTTYFIRSKISPDTFWYVDPSSSVVTASKSHRTKFRISYADNDNKKSNNVMINSDSIKITIAFEACSCNSNSAVFVQSDGELEIKKKGTDFKFGDIVNQHGAFEIGEIATGTVDSASIFKTADGEAWELV